MVADDKLAAIRVQPVGLIQVNAGERANPEVRQKLVRIQHAFQQTLHAVPTQQREQVCLIFSALAPPRNQVGEVGPVLQKPIQPLRKLRHGLKDFFIQHFHGKQRNQAHHGAHFHNHASVPRQADDIVEKLIFAVPQVDAFVIHVVHRTRDVEKVLKEFGGQALVGGVFLGQLQRHAHHVERKHRHPTGTI